MNQKTYRLVYSRLRGMLIAVAETASATGKSNVETKATAHASADARCVSLFAFRHVAFAALMMIGGGMPASADAQIVAAPGSGARVIPTQNGLPQVNIAAPSGAGVSVNTYSQFD
ncbi:MAG TPA: ESPR-type extended signal peptide-containing protein, partial [Paraburkholderia sp.]